MNEQLKAIEENVLHVRNGQLGEPGPIEFHNDPPKTSCPRCAAEDEYFSKVQREMEMEEKEYAEAPKFGPADVVFFVNALYFAMEEMYSLDIRAPSHPARRHVVDSLCDALMSPHVKDHLQKEFKLNFWVRDSWTE